MFERMDIAEKVYKVGTPSKTTTRADTKRASRGRKRKGRDSAFQTNPKKGHAGNRKKNHAGHTRDRPTGDKKS